jgi:hypothetical protein
MVQPIRVPFRKERQAGQKVVVGYPVGGSVTLPFHASMLRLLAYEYSKGDERLLAKITHTSGLYVADNRTMLAQQFLATPADWLWQVDTDIEFPADILETLLEMAGSDKRILAASVPLGAYESCAFMRSETPGIWQPIPAASLYPGPVKVDGIATAACLIHREVFEKIAANHGQCWFHHIYLPESPEGTAPRDFKFRSQGEDLAFSVRAQAEGFEIWCAHVPRLGHYKTRRLSHDDERARALAMDDSEMGELVSEG